jgi:hypothetical protein
VDLDRRPDDPPGKLFVLECHGRSFPFPGFLPS